MKTDYCLQVPVTQRPYTVHVPQNVPVNFVPVSVPRQDLGPIQVLEQDPFTYCELVLCTVSILGERYGFWVIRGFGKY